MTDPGYELQVAIVMALRAAGVAGGRVYDSVPQNAAMPYVNVGQIDVVDDGAECIDAVEVTVTIHTWSAAVGKPEAQAIQAHIRANLHEASLALATWALVDLRHRDSTTFSDPDNITTHGISIFRALIDPA